MANSSHNLFISLVDGISIAFSGTNRERLKKDISTLIGGLFSIIFLYCGVALFGYTPNISNSFSAVIIAAFSQTVGIFLGIVFIIFGGIGTLICLINAICLFFGSIRASSKEKKNPDILNENTTVITKKPDIPAKSSLIFSIINLIIFIILGVLLFV